jgi:predicted DNA-binding WGR domain protein
MGVVMRRFEFVEGSSNKFWEIEQDGSDLNIRWGRIGTQGQAQTKSFADNTTAAAAMIALVDQKTGKGYVESASTAGAVIGKIQPRTISPPSAPPPSAQSPNTSAAPSTQAPVAVPATKSASVPQGDSGVAPWLANGEPFEIPAAVLARALPSRRFPAVVKAGGDFETVVKGLRDAMKDHCSPDESGSDPSMRGALQTAWQRLQQPTGKAAPHADAALLALVFSAGTNCYGATIDVPSLVD